MSDAKFVMLANIIIEAVYIVSVTAAAIHFEKPSLLWWYVLLCFMGYSLKYHQKDGESDEKSDN